MHRPQFPASRAPSPAPSDRSSRTRRTGGFLRSSRGPGRRRPVPSPPGPISPASRTGRPRGRGRSRLPSGRGPARIPGHDPGAEGKGVPANDPTASVGLALDPPRAGLPHQAQLAGGRGPRPARPVRTPRTLARRPPGLGHQQGAPGAPRRAPRPRRGDPLRSPEPGDDPSHIELPARAPPSTVRSGHRPSGIAAIRDHGPGHRGAGPGGVARGPRGVAILLHAPGRLDRVRGPRGRPDVGCRPSRSGPR